MSIFRSGPERGPGSRFAPVPEDRPFPIVRDRVIQFADGTFTAVFRVSGFEYDLASVEDTERFVFGLRDLLRSLPPGVTLRIVQRNLPANSAVLTDSARLQDSSNAAVRYLAHQHLNSVDRMLEKEQVLTGELVILLSYRPLIRERHRGKGEPAPLIPVDAIVPRRVAKRLAHALSAFEDRLQPVVEAMSSSRLSPERLEGEHLRLVVREGLGPHLPGTGLTSEDWRVSRGSVQIGSRDYAGFRLQSVPVRCWPGMVIGALALPFESWFCVTVESKAPMRDHGSPKEVTVLPKTVSEPLNAVLTRFAPPQEGTTVRTSTEVISGELFSDHPFNIEVSFFVGAVGADELESRCGIVTERLRACFGEGVSRTMDGNVLARQVLATQPFDCPDSSRMNRVDATQAASLLPLFGRWKGSKCALTLARDPFGHLVGLDPFPANTLNKNRVIAGATGSGKSFLTQNLDILPFLSRRNTEVLVLDRGGSYAMLADVLGGVSTRLGPTSGLVYNAMDLPAGFQDLPHEAQEAELGVKAGFLSKLLVSMCRMDDVASVRIAEQLVGWAITRVYAVAPSPRLRDLYRTLTTYTNERDPEAEAVAVALCRGMKSYIVDTKGEAGLYATYFDGYTNFDIDSTIQVYDFINVANDPALCEPLSILYIGGLVYNRMLRRDGVKRLVVIDECGRLLSPQPGSSVSPVGEMIEMLWREGRKLGGACSLVGQNLSDLDHTLVSRAIQANSSILRVLTHGNWRKLDEHFRARSMGIEVSEAVSRLRTVCREYSEFLALEDGRGGVVRFAPTPLAHWITTTVPQDLMVRTAFVERYHQQLGYPLLGVLALLATARPDGGDGAGGWVESSCIQWLEEWTVRFGRFADRVARGDIFDPAEEF